MSPFLKAGPAAAVAIERPALDRVASILFWEYAARSWRSILFGPAIALLIPALILTVGWLTLSMESATAVLAAPPLPWMILLVLGAVVLVEQGQSRPRYTMPAPSWLLAGIPVACAVLTMFVQYGVIAWVVNRVLHFNWRFWGPGLHAALLMAWCQVIFFAAADWRSWKWIACLLSFVGLIALTITAAIKAPDNYETLSNQFNAPSGWYLALVAAAVPCLGIAAVLAFDRLRHGADFGLSWLVDLIGQRRLNRRSTWLVSFPSATAAQAWLEWTTRGYAYPRIALVISVVTLFLGTCLFPGIASRDGSELFVGLVMLFYVPLPLIGFFLGSRSSNFEFGDFSGSRPLADRQIGTAVLRSATLSLLAVAAICFVSFVLNMLLFGRWMNWINFGVSRDATLAAVLARLCLFMLESWFFVCLVTCIALAGRKAIVLALLSLAAWTLGGSLPFYIRFLDNRWFGASYLAATLLLLLATEVVGFVYALRRDLVTSWAVQLAVAIAAIAVILFMNTNPNTESWTVFDWLMELGVCCLAPLPLVAAPWAVYYNRHR